MPDLNSIVQGSLDILLRNPHGDYREIERDLLTNEHRIFVLFDEINSAKTFKLIPLKCRSQVDLIEQRLRNDSNLLVTAAVLRWLERTKLEPVEEQPADTQSVRPANPDSRFESGSKNSNPEAKKEAQVLQVAFQFLRKGSAKKAERYLVSNKQPWRAAILAGLTPRRKYNDSTRSDYVATILGIDKGDNVTDGNPNFQLCIETCWALTGQLMIDQSESSRFELAFFGYLSGNFGALEAVCRDSVYDYFWAIVRCWFIRDLMSNDLDDPDTLKQKRLGRFPRDNGSLNCPNSFSAAFTALHNLDSSTFKSPYGLLQIDLINAALKDDWSSLVLNMKRHILVRYEASDVGSLYCISLLRVASTLTVLLHLYEKDLTRDAQLAADEIICEYIAALCKQSFDVKVVEHYSRYLKFEESVEMLLEAVDSFPDVLKAYKKVLLDNCMKYFPNSYKLILINLLLKKAQNRPPISDAEDFHAKVTANLRDDLSKEIMEFFEMFDYITGNDAEFAFKLVRSLVLAGYTHVVEFVLTKIDRLHNPRLNHESEVLDALCKCVKTLQDYHHESEKFQAISGRAQDLIVEKPPGIEYAYREKLIDLKIQANNQLGQLFPDPKEGPSVFVALREVSQDEIYGYIHQVWQATLNRVLI